MLKFETENIAKSINLEWLVTNGIGGYASSTISGANTRRYHGLLVASLNPPVKRMVMVSKVEETIISADGNIELASNQYPGTIYPDGFRHIESFERDPLPKTNYSAREFRVSKTVFMVHGSNTTILEYENTGIFPVELQLTPFFLYRDYHSLYKEDDSFCHYFDMDDNTLKVYACDHSEPIFMRYSTGEFDENQIWHKNNEYLEEQRRGQNYLEDTFAIGNIIVTLSPGEKSHLTLSTDTEIVKSDPSKLKQQEQKRLKSLRPSGTKNKFHTDLAVAADQFIVWRESTQSYSIIAGYHWFTDWGRDTMIALQGLGIALGKKEVSKSILGTFFKSLDQGMLPNRFPDSEKDLPEYNTIDATLWLFDTLYKYYLKFGDAEFIKENMHHLEDIIQWHIKGTRYNIHVTEQGFLCGGEGLSQLTWMDARVDDFVVTPRQGMPVEIQALWYNALQVYLSFHHELSAKTKDFSKTVTELSSKLKLNFPIWFLNERNYLNDLLVCDWDADESIRPNQIYALSLSFPILEKEMGKSVLEIVDKQLYTPLGLRTLSPGHPDFRPVYGGNQWDRDTAYHQGTVWPFLLADYFKACIYVYGETPEVLEKMKQSIDAFQKHFYEDNCLYAVSEIFDGLNPDQGKGTIQQAWSVSTLIQLIEMSKLR